MKKLSLLLIMTATLFVGATTLNTGTRPTYSQAYWECMAVCMSPGNECHELCSAVAEATVAGPANQK